MNREILETLQAKLAENPSLNLDLEIPLLQIKGKRKHLPHPTAKLLQERHKPLKPKPQGFPAALLRSAAKPVVLNALSDAAKTLIFGATWEDGGSEGGDNLDEGIRRLLKHGELVTELLGRGGVLRCGDKPGFDIAIKVVPGSTKAPETEYSALQYLAKHVPDFPAPKPHGLLGLGNSRLILMSYIPSMTLRSVWSTLSHENKLSIQRQLNQLFTRLREIKQQDGRLGGVGGEGVSDSHAWVEHTDSETVMTTAAEFRDFQFSIEAPCGSEYAVFLKSLLPNPDANEPAVFTHGDVFPGNIMVDLDSTWPAEYVVTGIIDWEESGFYPPWFEASKVLYTFNEDGRNDIQDWWRYVPGCIAPASRPVEWAVGRLWDKANGVNA
jgi:aminoglycoside phosphotransferase (APT) family kinase protein